MIRTEFIKSISVLALVTIALNSLDANSTSFDQVGDGSPGGQSCHLRELELCFVGMSSIFQNPNGLPATEMELKRQCEYLNESTKCLHDYSHNCLSELQAPLVSMFGGEPTDLGRMFCDRNSELRKNYTKHVACLREVQLKHQRPCLLDLQAGFETIHKLNHSLRLPTICCNVNRLKECFFDRIEYECDSPAMDMVNWVLEKLAGRVVVTICRNEDPFGELCQSLLPKIGTKPYS